MYIDANIGQNYYERQSIDSRFAQENCIGIEGNFRCSACGKNYSCIKTLKRHVNFECGGQRRFACHHCTARYSQNGTLRRHLLKRHNVFVPPRRRLAQ